MSDSSDRTIPATPRRREAARRRGAMPTAAPLAWAATAVTAICLLPDWARATLSAAMEMMHGAIDAARGGVPAAWFPAAWFPAPAVALPTVAVVLAAGTAGLAVRVLCDGLSWQPGRLAADLTRIDPFAGLARIFSGRTLLAVIGNAVGLTVLVIVAALSAAPLVTAVAAGDGWREPTAAWMAAWRLLAWLAAAAAVVAACQYGWARRRFEQRIRMTPQEFADEAKSMQAETRVRLLHRGRSRQPASGNT